MSHAQEYFAKVLPWPQDGDAPAYVNIHWTIDKLNEKTGKHIWTGRAVRSVQEAVKTVDWARSLPETRDIYVCLSTQRNALEKTAKKTGRPYLLPIREQLNAVALKSLFIDLDAKGEDNKSYATIPDAAKALGEFIKTMDLPKPSVIVNSGGGLHVYWTLDRALTVAEWQPLAFALAEATKRHGLKCDTACTIDAARVLRVPGTLNRKLDTPRNVGLAGGRTGGDYTVERLERVLEPYKVAVPAAITTLPPRVPITGPSELSAGIDRGNTAPVDLNSVAGECEFIRTAIATGGKDYTNPLWNLTTLIATFSTGARADAHRMANAHPGYSQASTDDLYDRKEREREAKGLGWPSCRTVSATGFGGCATCKHYAAGKSPLHTAPPKPVAALLAPTSGAVGGTPVHQSGVWNDLPAGYKRLASNIVCQIIINADGSSSDEPISSYPMYDPSIQVQPVYTLNFTTIAESGRATQINVPTKEMSSKDSLRKVLLAQGLALREHESKRAMEFFMSWIEKLQKTKSAVVSSAPFGWSIDSKSDVEGFVYGGALWMPSGNRAAANPDPVLARRYKPTGKIEPWVAAAKLITDQKRPALDALIASAFAAPLIRFTHEPGVLMSAYSTKSGIGKTTTLKVAQAVWGDPIRAMQGLDDTQNYLFGKVGQLQSLPMYWDELKTEDDTKRFVKTVFKLTARKEKDRMTAAATMRESGSWQTLMACCSNDSIMDHVVQQTKNTAAGIYRVFEYEVQAAKGSTGQIDQADASRIVGKLDDNYGHVGLEYARYLGSNHAAIEKEVEAFYKAIGNEISTANEERYWRVMLACLLKGAEYANKLGFTEIDGFALKKFLFGVVDGLRVEKNSQSNDMQDTSNLSNVMQQFLNVMRARHTLKTNRIHTGRGKPAANSIISKTDLTRLDAVYVHVGTDDNKMRISKTYLIKWLNEHGYAVGPTLRSFATDFGAVTLSGRIASGTDFAGATEHLLEIDLGKTQQLDFINEA